MTPPSTPESHVTVSNESGMECDTDALFRLACFLLDRLMLHPDCEIGITLVDRERMTVLHEEWMDEPGPTDVLSFPMDELRSTPTRPKPSPGSSARSPCARTSRPSRPRRRGARSTRSSSSSSPTGCST